MLHYFYLLNRPWMHNVMLPALGAAWRQRSVAPCRDLCRRLIDTGNIADDALLHQVVHGMSYDRALWHALVSECLIFGADAMPYLPGLSDALLCLLAPQRVGAEPSGRTALAPIEQVYYGARDLRLGGGWHRPEHVGWNDTADLERLLAYLHAIDPDAWSPSTLARLAELTDDSERAEELAYIRDGWPALIEMVAQAHAAGQVIVCERP